MARSKPWIAGFWSLVSIASTLILVGAAMPAIATEFMYDRPPEAQSKVERAQIGLIVIALNLGTEVHVFGTVQNLSNITDFDFIPDEFPVNFGVLEVQGFSGLVVFVNSLGLRSGEVAVVEGFFYAITYENVSYGLVLGSNLWSTSLAIATGLSSGTLQPAKVFRPWWDETAYAMVSIGATVAVASAYAYSRRNAALDAAPSKVAAEAASPAEPPQQRL